MKPAATTFSAMLENRQDEQLLALYEQWEELNQ